MCQIELKHAQNNADSVRLGIDFLLRRLVEVSAVLAVELPTDHRIQLYLYLRVCSLLYGYPRISATKEECAKAFNQTNPNQAAILIIHRQGMQPLLLGFLVGGPFIILSISLNAYETK